MSENPLLSRWISGKYLLNVEGVLSSIKTTRRYNGSADLRGLIVGLDDQLTELEMFDFKDTELGGIDLSLAKFSCSFSRCVMMECIFDKAYFDTCRMVSSKFLRTSLKGISIMAPMLDDSDFEDCNFAQSKFQGRGAKSYGARRAEFRSCNFENVIFTGIELRACKFIKCSFEGVVFKRCILSGVQFQGKSPDISQFEMCDLK